MMESAELKIEAIKTLIDNKNKFVIIMDELDELYALVDYLLIYLKNVSRMGYKTSACNVEIENLYTMLNQADEILDNIVRCIRSNSDLDINKYKYYVDEIWLDRSEKNEDGTNNIARSLETYQGIMNEDINGRSLTVLWKYYKEKGYDSLDIDENDVSSLIASNIQNLINLFSEIKKYQRNVIIQTGYKDSLSYISKKYAIEKKSIELLVKNLHGNTTRLLVNDNIYEWAPQGVLKELNNVHELSTIYMDFDDAISFLVKCFGELDEDFANMIIRAKAEYWIDHEKRKGKMNGSYTNNIIYTGESIISMTYSNTVEDMCKLAHELGHAYHGYRVSKNGYFKSDFSIITAETFALFCENYILVKYIIENKNDSYKRDLYCSVLETYLINIKAFLFEYRSFQELENTNSVSPNQIYREILKDIGICDMNIIEENEWIFRSQNFFSEYFYYNFVYIIGEVFGIQMVLRVLQGDLAFASIKSMLDVSGEKKVDSLFEMVGLDLESEDAYDIKKHLDSLWNHIKILL